MGEIRCVNVTDTFHKGGQRPRLGEDLGAEKETSIRLTSGGLSTSNLKGGRRL